MQRKVKLSLGATSTFRCDGQDSAYPIKVASTASLTWDGLSIHAKSAGLRCPPAAEIICTSCQVINTFCWLVEMERDQFIVLLGAASGRLRSEQTITLRIRRRTTMTGSNEDGDRGKEREGGTDRG